MSFGQFVIGILSPNFSLMHVSPNYWEFSYRRLPKRRDS